MLFQKITLVGCVTLSDIPDDPNSPDYNEKREALIAELIASVAENEKLVKEAFRLSDFMHQKQEEAHAAEIKTLELKLRNQEIEFKKRLKIETIKQEQRSGLEATEQELRLKVELHELELKLKVAAKEHERELNLERSKNQATLMIERNNSLRAHHGSLARVLAMLTTVNSKRHAQKAEAEKSQIESLTEQLAAMKVSLDQNLETEIKRPVTSDALEDWHHNIRLKEGINVKKTTTDYNRINDFIAFAGDQPVNKYKFDQFQKYAIMLAAVPSNYNKKPDLRDMSLEDVSTYNQNLSDNERLETLSAKTIETNYLSLLRVFFKDMGNQYEFTSPVVDNKFRLPTFTKGTVDRKPFTVDELNKWFAVSANAKQPDMKWMPLLGSFTGARVGELVTLQRKDIYKVESGGWVIDLTTDIIDADGAARVRKVKNTSSRRIIALPEFVIKTGFIDYVKTIPRDSNLFPGCFYHGKTRVKDPAGAASKRLNTQLKKAGLHSNIETTFHSTRHTAKDMMRVARVDERTHDKQTGHSNKTVSRNYGAKNLLNEEIEVLRALPIPEGLDLSPYLSDE
ncbi:MAG: tyrosine-type recombinase/integrase [Lentilitoribacter sp.]